MVVQCCQRHFWTRNRTGCCVPSQLARERFKEHHRIPIDFSDVVRATDGTICTGCPTTADDAGQDGPTWTHVPKSWHKKETCERIAIRLNHIVQHDDDEDDPSTPSRKRDKRQLEDALNHQQPKQQK